MKERKLSSSKSNKRHFEEQELNEEEEEGIRIGGRRGKKIRGRGRRIRTIRRTKREGKDKGILEIIKIKQKCDTKHILAGHTIRNHIQN